LSISSQKYRLGIRKKPIPHLGSRIQGSKRHRIPDPQHWDKGTRKTESKNSCPLLPLKKWKAPYTGTWRAALVAVSKVIIYFKKQPLKFLDLKNCELHNYATDSSK
jgi:hypothetical protein